MSSDQFLIGLFAFLVLSLVGSCYILDTNPSSHMSFGNIFSHSVGCLLALLVVSFAKQKVFVWMWSQEFLFAFVSLASGDTPRENCHG